MKKLLTICPTRNRSKIAYRMLESFYATSSISEILFIVDYDDPELIDYIRYKEDVIIIPEDLPVSQKINKVMKRHSNFEFYHVTSDDFIYRTKDWDKILCNKGRISFGNDLMNGASLPVTSVVDGDIVRALGWIILPTLTYLYGDNVWKYLGERLNILDYYSEVIIEHMHWINKKAPIDATYQIVNSVETYRKDGEAFEEWRRNQASKDIEAIRAVLGMQLLPR